MELARRQAALARLAVDAELLEQFLSEPSAAAAGLGIAPHEAELLASRVGGLARFARSLVSKRLGEARRLLPRTALLLGERFDTVFRRYAATTPSRGPRRHERDALALADRLASELTGEARQALLYEKGWIQARLGRQLVVRRLGSGSVAVWLRLGRQLRHWRFGGVEDWTNTARPAQESK